MSNTINHTDNRPILTPAPALNNDSGVRVVVRSTSGSAVNPHTGRVEHQVQELYYTVSQGSLTIVADSVPHTVDGYA